MGKPEEDYDRDYLVLRSRKVPRPPAEYEDAHSVARESPRQVINEEGDEERKTIREQEIRKSGTEDEENAAEALNMDQKEIYMEFLQGLQQDFQATIAQSVRDLCQQMVVAFTDRAHEMEDRTRLLLEYTVERERLIKELLEQGSSDPERRRWPIKEPMPFSGANPREWLLQMQQYYDLRGFNEELRLKDVPFHLRGDAHLFYYTLVQHYPEQIPKTWEGFVKLLTQRFSSRTPVETLQRLMQIKYRDSVSDVTTQFARVCAEGDPLPQDKLIHVYLSRFPKAMVEEAMKVDFSTWVEASEYLQRQNRRLTMRLAEWYQLAPPEFKREVEMDKQCMREGWILKNPANTSFRSPTTGKQGPGGKGADTIKEVLGVSPGQQGQDKTNFNKFSETLVCQQCQGKGHRAKECPSRDLAARRDGSKCNKCGGLGHWARSCPSPRLGGNFKREALLAAQPVAPDTAAEEGVNAQA